MSLLDNIFRFGDRPQKAVGNVDQMSSLVNLQFAQPNFFTDGVHVDSLGVGRGIYKASERIWSGVRDWLRKKFSQGPHIRAAYLVSSAKSLGLKHGPRSRGMRLRMKNETGVTFVNVIEVDPSRQQELLDLLKEGYERTIRHRPGFISGALLASADGGQVVNLAKWRSPHDVKATQGDAEAAAYARKTAEIARARPMICDVVAEYSA